MREHESLDDAQRRVACAKIARDIYQARMVPLIVVGYDMSDEEELMVLSKLDDEDQVKLTEYLLRMLKKGTFANETKRLK